MSQSGVASVFLHRIFPDSGAGVRLLAQCAGSARVCAVHKGGARQVFAELRDGDAVLTAFAIAVEIT